MNTGTEAIQGHRTFHEKLDLLKRRLLEMSQRAEDLLAVAVTAFLRRDTHKSEEVLAASTAFVGDILQVPPMVSALKVDGRRPRRRHPRCGCRYRTG